MISMWLADDSPSARSEGLERLATAWRCRSIRGMGGLAEGTLLDRRAVT